MGKPSGRKPCPEETKIHMHNKFPLKKKGLSNPVPTPVVA
jgi:hypothetical protein